MVMLRALFYTIVRFTAICSLFGGRQQPCLRPSHPLLDDRRTRCWRPLYNDKYDANSKSLPDNGVARRA